MPGFSLIWPNTPRFRWLCYICCCSPLGCSQLWQFLRLCVILMHTGKYFVGWSSVEICWVLFSWINWSHQFGWRRLQRQRHFCHILPRVCVAVMVLTVSADGQTAWWTSPSLLPLSIAGCVEGTLQPAPEQLGVSFLLFEGWTSETTWVSFAQDTHFSSPLWAFVWIHGCLFYPLDSNPVSFYF